MPITRNMSLKDQENEACSNQLADIQQSLNEINIKLNGLDKSRKEISDLTTLVNILKEQNEEKDKNILELEPQVDELEQYTRQDDLVISGLKLGTSHMPEQQCHSNCKTARMHLMRR